MMMQPQGGLLAGAMQQPQAQQPQQPGGLLGGYSSQAPASAAPAGGASPQGLQMAMALAQNPTPQMVQQIITKLHASGNQEAAVIEQHLQQLGDDPGRIKQFADMLVQHIQGG